MSNLGPLQLIVIDFQNALLPKTVHGLMNDLQRRGILRTVDSLVAVKGQNDELIVLDSLDAPQAELVWSGVLGKSLFGTELHVNIDDELLKAGARASERIPEMCVTEDQLLEVADLIPANSRALVLLVEHLWVTHLEAAASGDHGHVLASCWISPALLGNMIHSDHSLFE